MADKVKRMTMSYILGICIHLIWFFFTILSKKLYSTCFNHEATSCQPIKCCLFLGDVYDDQHHSITYDGSCPDASLGDGCSISEDCSKITCKMDFVDKPITLTLKVITSTLQMSEPFFNKKILELFHSQFLKDTIVFNLFTYFCHSYFNCNRQFYPRHHM